MAFWNTRKIKGTLFGMLYVMRDGNNKPSQTAMRDLIILFLIDMGQVLRVLMSPFYGWNKSTYDVAKHIDMVYNLTKLMSFIVPRYTLFGIAFILVVVAIGDALYCAKLFKAGDISKIGPVKALRFLVALVVTTLFSSVMKWLLIPLECLASHEPSLSSYIRGEEAPCTPWRFPEIVATAPTLVVVVVYVCFAFTATYFSVCTNPLAFAPNVQATGRVEALFLASKVLGTFLVFLSEHITPVATNTVLLVLNVAVFYCHLTVLPFHSHTTNMLRGGIYFCISWLSFASLLVAVIGSNGLLNDDVFQTLQWMLVGFLPVAFTIGIWITHHRRASLLLSIDRLRGEFESYQLQGMESPSSPAPHPQGNNSSSSNNNNNNNEKNGPMQGHSGPTLKGGGRSENRGEPRSAYESFFDPSWERKRAFSSGQHAHTIARTLLMQRREADLPFLSYVMGRSLDEHAGSELLQIFRVSLLRFVLRSTSEAAAEEKRIKGSHKALALDHEYILYAVDRKASQDYAAATMGNGTYTAINLMEFDSGMQTARTAHMACLVEMRKFWQAVGSRRRRQGGLDGQVQHCIGRLVEFNRAQEKAEAEYLALLDKYPQSVQLLQSYASFCDAVNNDVRRADSLYNQAAALEGDAEVGSGGDVGIDQGDAMSAATSQHETFRLRTLRAFSQWSELIWGQEWQQLLALNRRVRGLFLALLLVSVGGFLTMQLWLFESLAERDVHLINMTGLLRAWAVSACFLLRSQFLSALAGDAEGFAKAAETVTTLSGRLQAQHWDNYEIIRTNKVRDYYLEPSLDLMVPTGLGWHPHKYTFWEFGTDWTRRMERAAQTTVQELTASSDWSLGAVSEGQLNMQFLSENAFRAGIPAFESIVKLYEVEMQAVWGLTQTIVLVATVVNVAIQVAIGVLVVWGVRRTIQQMQHMSMACMLAIQLPAVTSKKLAKFYKDAEAQMRSADDEQAEMQRVLDEADSAPVPMKRRLSVDSRPGDPLHQHQHQHQHQQQEQSGQVTPLSAENLERFQRQVGHCSPLRSAHDAPQNTAASKRHRVSMADECVVCKRKDVADDDDAEGREGREGREGLWVGLGVHAEVVRARGGAGPGAGVWSAAPEPRILCQLESEEGRQEEEVVVEGAQCMWHSPMAGGAASVVGAVAAGRCACSARARLKPPPSPPQEEQGAESASTPSASGIKRTANGNEGADDVGVDDDDTPPVSAPSHGAQRTLRRASAVHGVRGCGVSSEHDEGREDEVELLPLNEVPPSAAASVRVCLRREWPLAVRTSVHVCASLLCVGLAVLNTSFPTRGMQQLVTLAPTINQAGRRRFLTRSCVHLARELVLDDGFSRMDRTDVASALHHYLEELKLANDAVRLGGALDIGVGADYRNQRHNDIMYGKGCPWRPDPTDCSTPERPGAAANGAYHLALSFFDAVQSVLIRFGPDPSEYRDDFLTNPRLRLNDHHQFSTVMVDGNRTRLLAEDAELVFVLSSFSGDVFSGFALLVEVLDEELRGIVRSASADNEVTFAVYMLAMFGGFYLLLFREAVNEARRERVKARAFVARIPSYTLSQLEIDTVASIFRHPIP